MAETLIILGTMLGVGLVSPEVFSENATRKQIVKFICIIFFLLLVIKAILSYVL